MRKILIGIGVLVFLIVGAAIVVPSFIDWNRYKGEIKQQVIQATGRNLTIVGDLDLTILPAPRLRVKDLRFTNIKGGSLPEMVKLEALDIQVRVLPLLQGRIEVASVLLIKPTILFERLADGRANWELAPAKKSSAEKKPATKNSDGTLSPAATVQLDNVRIQNGVIVWRDAVAGSEERLNNVSLQFSARSLNGPFDVRGEALVRKQQAILEAAIGELKPMTAAPVSLSITLPKADIQAQISGSVVAIGAPPRFTGKLNLRGKNLSRTIKSFVGDTNVPDALKQPFLLKASLKGTEKGGSVSGIDIEVGATRASGNIDVTLYGRPKFVGKMAVTRIDLDSLLKTNAKQSVTAVRKGSTSNAPQPTGARKVSKPVAARQAGSAFALPEMDGTFELTIDAVTYKKRNARGIEVSAQLEKNTVQLRRARILLPGGGEFNLTGAMTAHQGWPNYQAEIAVRADNLRALLTWLGRDVTSIPQDRLRKFSLSASLRGDDRQLQIQNAKIGLDATKIDAAVTLALRKRLAFGASISIDNLDLDAYQVWTNVKQKAGNQSSPVSQKSVKRTIQKTPNGKQDKAASAILAPLAALTEFDANLNMQVSRLTVNKTPVRGLQFEGTLAGGILKIKNASIRDVGGLRALVSGNLSNLSGFPTFSGEVSADARDVSGPLRLAGITLPPNARKLGAFRLRGKADTSSNKVKVDLSLAAAGATTFLTGTVSDFDRVPRIDAILTSKHKDLSQLLRAFGNNSVSRRLGPFDLNFRAKGDLSKLSAHIRLRAAGGKLTANGTARGLIGTPTFALNIAASHPSVRSFVRHFAPNYRPTGKVLGPLKINTELSGRNQNYSLGKFSIDAGALALKGTGNLDTRGARPKLTAVFDANQINVNSFLPPKQPASSSSSRRQPVTRGGRSSLRTTNRPRSRSNPSQARYSVKPIDTTPLGLIDADVSIAAKSLLYRQFKVDNPAISATLSNKLLTINKIAGKMFDGTFLLNGKFDARRTPILAGRVVVSKANVGKALFQTGTFDIKGGVTDFDLSVSSDGKSPLAMVRRLNGSGKLNSRNGIVSGFDLKAISDRLKNIDSVIDLLSLFGSSMQGGQSRFSTLKATFKIDKGVVRTNDVLLLADAAAGRATGFANLPNWHMDFESQFRLIEHPKVPAFKLRAVGAIDNPRRFFDFKELQSFLLQRGVGSVIRKIFPGSRRSNPRSVPTQQQPKRPRLEDLIPGVFDLLKRH
ncbi:MAG: AsmA family protein [Alphaproteobacteria bacterium]